MRTSWSAGPSEDTEAGAHSLREKARDAIVQDSDLKQNQGNIPNEAVSCKRI
jgi:hypothetical protein